jgi:protein-disulfide isomerase
VPQLEQLLKKYPGKVKLVFKNFPIRSHKYAVKAAVAALAAERQEKFWEFHNMLFENYNRLNDQKIQEIVGLLVLDETKFKEQQKNPAITERIRQDYEEGIRLGVRGTPTIFINGKKLRDRGMKSMEAVIEKELQKQQEKSQKETTQ